MMLRGLLLALAAATTVAVAAEPAAEPPLRVRRIYAPADRVADWPTGGQRFVPIEADRFEQLLGEAQATTGSGQLPPTARVGRALFQARLDNDALVDGEARLEIDAPAGQAALVPLRPCNLAVHSAYWADEPTRPAAVGLAASGDMAVLARGRQTLVIKWSLRGRSDEGGSRFSLQIPSAAVSMLTINAPAGWEVRSTAGLVQRTNPASASRNDWELQCAGRPNLDLFAAPAGRPNGPVPELRQSIVYECGVHGLDISSTLEFDVRGADPLGQLSLELDPGVTLLSVKRGDRSAAWSVVSADEVRPTLVDVLLPEPIQGLDQVVRVRAAAPLHLGRAWNLPRITVRNVFWQQATMTLVVPAPLQVRQVLPEGCRQSSTAALPAPRSGEALQFDAFAQDARLNLLLENRPAKLQATVGTVCEIGGGEMKAKVLADLRATEGERFLLTAEVGASWNVDSVESMSDDVLANWAIDRNTGRRTLKVFLAKALSATRPVRLRINAHHVEPPADKPLGIADIVPLRFDLDESRRWVALAPLRQLRLSVSGDEQLERIEPSNLDAKQRELLAGLSPAVVFADDAGAAGLQVVWESGKSGYSAEILVEADAVADALHERYRIDINPQSMRLESVAVHFGQKLDSPVRWTLVGDERPLDVQVAAANVRRRAGLLGQEDAWEIRLPVAQSSPFTLVGVARRPFDRPAAVRFVSAGEAAQQAGRVVVRAHRPVRMASSRIALLPSDPSSARPASLQCWAAAYDPVRDVALPDAMLTLAPVGSADQHTAWVCDMRLRSRYQRDGTAVHLALFRIQHFAADLFTARLPKQSTAEIRGVWLDGAPATWQNCERDGGRSGISINLPAGKSFASVAVQYVTQGPSLARHGHLEPLLPECNVPVLSRGWTAWLPPDFEAVQARRAVGSTTLEELSWTERLLGPLAGQAGSNAWRWVLGRTPSSMSEGDRRRCDEFFARLGRPLEQRADTDALTLGKLFAEIGDDPVWFDVAAFDGLGISPTSVVHVSQSDPPPQRAHAAVARANLCVIFGPNETLITTQAVAALHAHVLRGVVGRPAYVLRANHGRSDEFAEIDRSTALPAKVWLRSTGAARSPWIEPQVGGGEAIDYRGWNAYHLSLDSGTPAALVYVRRATTAAFGWLAFLAAALSGCAYLVDRPRALLIVSLLALVAALFVGPLYASIATGVVLGLMVTNLYRIVRPRPGHGEPWRRVTSVAEVPSTLAGPIPLALLLVAVSVWLAIAPAQGAPAPSGSPRNDEAAVASTAQGTLHDVIVPIDEQQKPVDGKCYVSEQLLQLLYRRAEGRTVGWLLSNAVYQGSWVARSADRGPQFELKATYELTVFDRASTVRVPLEKGKNNVTLSGATLDGRPIELRWDPAATALLAADVPAGVYRLVIDLRVDVSGDAGQSTIDLAIPRVASSRLELLVPPGGGRVEAPNAQGPVVLVEDPRRLIAELGPSGRLNAVWHVASRAPGSLAAVELLWLKVQPGSVVIDARWKCDAGGRSIRQVLLSVDPRLKIVPPAGDSSIASIDVQPGRPQTIRLLLDKPMTGAFAFDLRFLVSGATGLGNLRLPQIDLPQSHRSRRLMGLSIEPNLLYEPRSAERIEPLSIPDFLAEWGHADAPPQSAYRLPMGTANWELSTRPRRVQVVAESVVSVSLAQGMAEIQFDAQLETSFGQAFQYRATGPAGLQLQSVALVQDAVDRVARWSVAADGQITILLNGPVSGVQSLNLRGRVPLPLRSNVPLPLISLNDAQLRDGQLRLYRRPSVLVNVGKASGVAPGRAGIPTENEQGRLVSTLSFSDPLQVRVPVNIVANRPTVRVDQSLSVDPQNDWTLRCDFTLNISDGVLDEIQIVAPSQWAGPFQCEPAAVCEIIDPPGEARFLVLKPTQAVQGKYAFRVSGPLQQASGRPLLIPPVRLRHYPPNQNTVRLPLRIGDRLAAWETQGLKQISPVSADTAVYRMVGETFRAALVRRADEAAKPELLWTFVQLDCHSATTYQALATMALVPGEVNQFTIELPGATAPVALAVAGMSVYPEPLGNNQWRFTLPQSRYPQPVELLYAGSMPAERVGERGFQAPVLLDTQSRRTIWLVSGNWGENAFGADRIAALGAHAILGEGLIAVLQQGLAMSDVPREAWPAWQRAWQPYWNLVAAAADRDWALASSRGTPSEDESKLRQRFEQLSRKWLELTDTIKARGQRGLADKPAATLWYAPASSHADFWLVDGPSSWLRLPAVESALPSGHRTGSRPVAVLLLLAAILLAARFEVVRFQVDRWPCQFAFLFGLAWWWALQPAVIGLGIMLLAVVIWLARRRRQSARQVRLA